MEATGKRHIFLTGSRGSGKSTLLDALAQGKPTFRTRVEPGQAVYWQDFLIGQYDPSIPGQMRKMRPVEEEGFRQAAARLEERNGQWLCIDEVGYLDPDWFVETIKTLMKTKRLILAVRKEELYRLPTDDALVVDLDGLKVGCVVMASGLGRRFGGNKLLAELEGKPLICHGLEAAKAVFENTVLVTRYEAAAKLHDHVVLHELPYRSDTVRLGVQALEDAAGWVFLPGDQPFVAQDSLYALALCAENTNEIWQLGGSSPTAFPRWAMEELKNLPRGKGGSVLMHKYGAKSLAAPEKELQDIDTKEDLKKTLD